MESVGLPCALGDHAVRNPVYVTNPKHTAFIRKRNKEFRPEEEVCQACLNSLIEAYTIKLAKAKQLVRSRRVLTISSTTNFSETDGERTFDEIDALVRQTPRNKSLKEIVTRSINSPLVNITNGKPLGQRCNISSTDDTEISLSELPNSQSSSGNSIHHSLTDESLSQTIVAAPTITSTTTTTDAVGAVVVGALSSSQSSLDLAPSTSAAAVRKQPSKAKHPPRTVSFASPFNRTPLAAGNSVGKGGAPPTTGPATVPARSGAQKRRRLLVDDDSDDFMPSPNALNGSRLPHVQPVLKTKKFHHPDQRVMDIYVAGTTGG